PGGDEGRRPGSDDQQPAHQVPEGRRLREHREGAVRVGRQVTLPFRPRLLTSARPLAAPMPTPRLEVTGARKQFPGVLALDGVALTLAPGEVLAVVGENGAGKSTLMKIVGGVYRADAGEVRLDSIPVHFAGPADAIRAGVSLI